MLIRVVPTISYHVAAALRVRVWTAGIQKGPQIARMRRRWKNEGEDGDHDCGKNSNSRGQRMVTMARIYRTLRRKPRSVEKKCDMIPTKVTVIAIVGDETKTLVFILQNE